METAAQRKNRQRTERRQRKRAELESASQISPKQEPVTPPMSPRTTDRLLEAPGAPVRHRVEDVTSSDFYKEVTKQLIALCAECSRCSKILPHMRSCPRKLF